VRKTVALILPENEMELCANVTRGFFPITQSVVLSPLQLIAAGIKGVISSGLPGEAPLPIVPRLRRRTPRDTALRRAVACVLALPPLMRRFPSPSRCCSDNRRRDQLGGGVVTAGRYKLSSKRSASSKRPASVARFARRTRSAAPGSCGASVA
jgi:hypothetical protein